jgi:hypothetical protein
MRNEAVVRNVNPAARQEVVRMVDGIETALSQVLTCP